MRQLFPLLFLLLLPAATSSQKSAGGPRQVSPLNLSFHHLHLNSLAPSKAIDFYTRTFDVTKKTSLAGFDGVRSEEIYLLFDRVKRAPAAAPDSAIWHFGWGST